ncbi:MAG: hypothetical protein IKZ92_09670 [Muribaculaceae bacterium]|nr:hypothetical protein [Muribaculaceae bacterium]
MIDRHFISTLSEIPGYEIVETKGIIQESSPFKGEEGKLKKLVKKAEEAGCNAIVNIQQTAGYGYHVMYGDAVIVRPKSHPAPVLPDVPDFTNPDNDMKW